MAKKNIIDLSKTALGIELGSSRIKAVLIDSKYSTIATGEYEWENKFENGNWTYKLSDAIIGLQGAYRELSNEVEKKFGFVLTRVGSLGISGMMHGYLAFDENDNQLVSFRTWRNTTTERAAEELTSLFRFNIPQRWSVAHLYQAILNQEKHVEKVNFLTTLGGYIHWQLTGEKILGVGDAAGMFPIDTEKVDYDEEMIEQFNVHVKDYHYQWSLKDILPEVKTAGNQGGLLTVAGAKILDPSGKLQPGIALCPSESDAGTGMAATNSVAAHTGNVSAGTSIFSMIVLDKPLSDHYIEIDLVTTPTGKPVAMVHCNNFTSDINDWVGLFAEISVLIGKETSMGDLFTILFKEAMKADSDIGKIVSCNYHSGEPITRFEEGRPLLVRMPDSKLTLPNFMRAQIYSSLATLKIGMDLLTREEKVQIDFILGHGGFFKTEEVGQQLMADALSVPVSVMDTAGEGGPWGMALLAAYSVNKKNSLTFESYLANEVFVSEETEKIEPDEDGVRIFSNYMERYNSMLNVERAAIDYLK